MKKITAIEKQKTNSNRFNIYLDGKYSLSLSGDAVILNKLKVGKSIDDKFLNILNSTEIQEKAYIKMLNFISYRARSMSEINFKIDSVLLGNDLEELEVRKIKEFVIEKLKKLNLYNDSNISTAYIEQSKHSRAPLGRNKIVNFLQKKGISKSSIEDLLHGYIEYEIIGAKEEFEKKRRKMGKGQQLDIGSKAKISKFLAGKGYSWEAINAVVDSKFEL